LVIFQALFDRLGLKERLRKCFRHRNVASIFGHHTLFLILVVHLLLGHRRLRDLDFYKEDPLVRRVVGVRRLPDVSTISRSLKQADLSSVENVRELLREGVLERVEEESLARITLDFDGSVLSTRRRAEGTAVGFNPKRKGDRSYYPLFCTVAQTSQFLDVHFRSGNVHDSNGALDFMRACVSEVRDRCPRTRIEARVDSAFFGEDLLAALNADSVEFTCSVPFERLPELKGIIEARRRWTEIDPEWAFFEPKYQPRS